VFAAFVVLFYKLYLVACCSAAKAMKSICFGIDAATRRVVPVERAADMARAVGRDAVVRKNGCQRKAGFDVGYFHCFKIFLSNLENAKVNIIILNGKFIFIFWIKFCRFIYFG